MQADRIDIAGILKAFALALMFTSASAAYAATFKDATFTGFLSGLHIIELSEGEVLPK